MTPPKRWPDHCEWARTDTIARMKRICEGCDKLMAVASHPAMQVKVMEIKQLATETELAMVRVRG